MMQNSQKPLLSGNSAICLYALTHSLLMLGLFWSTQTQPSLLSSLASIVPSPIAIYLILLFLFCFLSSVTDYLFFSYISPASLPFWFKIFLSRVAFVGITIILLYFLLSVVQLGFLITALVLFIIFFQATSLRMRDMVITTTLFGRAIVSMLLTGQAIFTALISLIFLMS